MRGGMGEGGGKGLTAFFAEDAEGVGLVGGKV